jgi:hypothetical protein
MAAGDVEVSGCLAVSCQSADEPAQHPTGQQDERDEDGHGGNGAGQPGLSDRLVKVVVLDGGKRDERRERFDRAPLLGLADGEHVGAAIGGAGDLHDVASSRDVAAVLGAAEVVIAAERLEESLPVRGRSAQLREQLSAWPEERQTVVAPGAPYVRDGDLRVKRERSSTDDLVSGRNARQAAVVGLGDLWVAYPDMRRVTNDVRLVGDRRRRDA